MKKIIFTIFLLISCLFSAYAEGKEVMNVEISRDYKKTVSAPTLSKVDVSSLSKQLGFKSTTAFETALAKGTVKLESYDANGKAAAHTYDFGYWFTEAGIPCPSGRVTRAVACKYEDGYFKVVHYQSRGKVGKSYSFDEYFINNTDTVQFNITVTFAEFEHRADHVDSWGLSPSVYRNDEAPVKENFIQVMVGDKITLSCTLPEGHLTEGTKYPRFTWKNKKGKILMSVSKTPELVIEDAKLEDAGYYILNGTYYTAEGKRTIFQDCYYYVDVQTEPLGTPFSWEGRIPMFSHDWTTDATYKYGKWTQPQKMHTIKKKNGTSANQYAGEWWSAFWGDNLNAEVGGQEKAMEAAKNMVEKYDSDFAYIRDHMGWPPDKSARDGYKSFVYIFGSGLANDNTSNTEKGGYQGNTYVDGGNYACVWASYYPFSRFRSDADKKWSDGDYQREAMIHEGIHAIFADLGACSKSAWFHEAGNTWLQSAMNTERYNKYGTPGFLDACPLVAPFMPIECYSGWLQDGSFGGPTAEGVNMYNGSQQICTWRNLLGGNQYGNSFPIILGEICGKGSIPWIWRNCKDYVLKSIGTLLGEETMRQLIQQYRSRMATFDIGGWKTGYRKIMNDNIGLTVKAEWEPYWIDVAPFKLTPYQGVTKNSDDGWLAPDTLTNPGWSGCNIIPIHVDSKSSKAVVEFRPEDTEMRAQLCYVTKAGKNYYSQPVQCGKMQIDLSDRPANNVIFCVVCNTDYIYTNDNNEAQRKKHWDYRLRLGEGALQIADLYCKWSLNESTITDANYNETKARDEKEKETGIRSITQTTSEYYPGQNGVRLMTGYMKAGMPITVQLAEGISSRDVTVSMLGLSGIVCDEAPLQGNSYTLPRNLRPGVYFIKFIQNGKCDTYKVYVK